MADIFKSSIEAGREVRSRGQTGEAPSGDASLGVMADQIRTGMGAMGGMGTVPTTRATAIAPPTTSAEPQTTEDLLSAISARPTRDPEEIAAEEQAASQPGEVGFTDSVAKSFKGLMVTWDFLANKLEKAVTGQEATTAPILQKGVEEYKAMASDPRIQELIQRGNEAEGYYDAGKAMLGYVLQNPGVVVNFLGEQVAPVIASIPTGGVAGGIARAAVGRTALSAGTQAAVTAGATGAAINSSAVVLGSLGSNYVEGLDKFNGDKAAATDYATTKTLAEVPANAVAGMFLGINPFGRVAGRAPTAAAVGNVGFQTGIQGAGGGLGAYQAATAVGEEAGKGEILAEIFGEGLMAPVDIVQARREARGLTPPPSQQTPPTSQAPAQPTPPVSPAPSDIVMDSNFDNLSDVEFQSAVSSPAFMAAMYSQADANTRAKLQAAAPTFNLEELSQDANLVMDGMSMAESPNGGAQFVSLFNKAIDAYKAPEAKPAQPAQTSEAPFDGGETVQKQGEFIPARPNMALAQSLADEAQMRVENDAAAKQKTDEVSKIVAQVVESLAKQGIVQLPAKDTAPAPAANADTVNAAAAEVDATPRRSGERPLNQLSQAEARITAAQESNVAEGLRPAEATAQPEVKAEPAPAPAPVAKQEPKAAKPKKQKKVKFQEVTSAPVSNQVSQDQGSQPRVQEEGQAVEPVQAENQQPSTESVSQQVQSGQTQDSKAQPTAERKRVIEKPEDFVGPNKDRLYEEGAEKLDLTEKILEKYPFGMRRAMIARIKPMKIEDVRKLWAKVSNKPDAPKPKFEQEPNQFDDDTGGVMSNMARSGAMGMDAIAELKNKERVEAARRAQLEEEVRLSTQNMNRRAKEETKKVNDKETFDIASTQQQEIGGTTIGGGFINPEGTVGVQPEPEATVEDTADMQPEADATMQLAEAISKGELTLTEAKKLAREEGIGNYALVEAMRQYGIDPTPNEINQSGVIAANYTLRSFIRDSGYNGYQAREMWLKSYDSLKNKADVELTKTEQAAYDNWKSNRAKYINRLENAVEGNEYQAGTLEDVFPNALFNQFTLNEMRNPETIDGPLQGMVRDLFPDPEKAWMEDVAAVLTARPDFEAQVNDALTKDEKAAFDDYRNRQLREAMKTAEMKVKSPAYSQLDQLRYLSPELYQEYAAKIAVAEQNQLAVILHEASEMNDRAEAAIKAGADPENTIDAQMREYMLRDEQQSKSPDEMEDDMGDGTALYKRGNYSGAVTALIVQEHLTNKFAKWDNKPAYTVVQNANQLPTDTAERLTSRFENGSFKGALDPKTGHIYLFSDFMENVEDAEFVMFHELYGHWGVRAFLGDKVDTFLENQYKTNQRVREAADSLRKEAAEQGMPMGRLESVEEAISDIAAKGDISLFKQIVGRLQAWLKANGFDTVAKWMGKSGEAELAYILSSAKRAARSQGITPLDGAPTDVRYAANKLPVEVFATRDGKTTAYARINPINFTWTVFKIEDIKTNDFSVETVEDYAQVLAILKKMGDTVRAKDRATRINIDPSDFVDIPDPRKVVGMRRTARKIQMKIQNQYLPVFEVAEYLKSQGRENEVIENLKLYEGRTKYFVDHFEQKYQAPIQRLLKKIGDLGGSVENVDLYLLARHAEERNKAIRSITNNPTGSGMGPKPRTLPNGDVIPGYLDVLKEASEAKWAKELEALGKLTDQMSRDKANYMLSTGLISKSTYEGINQYDHYVTLSGNDTDLEVVDTTALGGRAFNLRGADAKRALGRGTLPVDILQNTMNGYLSTIIRGQKAQVVRAVVDMMERNPDPNFAVVEEISTTKRLNTAKMIQDNKILGVIGDKPSVASGKQFLDSVAFRMENGDIDGDAAVAEIRNRIREAEARRDISPEEAAKAMARIDEEVAIAGRLSPDGYVSVVEDPTKQNADNVLVAKVDGKPVRVVFKEKGIEFISALSGMHKQSGSETLEAIGAWGRFFSQLVTSWNPAWTAINGFRDFQTVLTNMATDPRVGTKLANEMRKEWTGSFRTAFRYMVARQGSLKDGWWGSYLASRDQKHPLSAEDAAMYEEFRKSGAETFFLDRKNTEESLESMNRHMNGPNGVLDWTKGKMEGLGSLLELMTLPMETAPRFAVYKVLRRNGWSIEDAAIYAKEVSVNFNMKGSSSWLRNLYVFANPSIQGTYRLFQNYSRSETGAGKYLPSNRFAAVMGSWMMLGILGNFLARGLGGEDDDLPGVDKLDQIPHHKRSTSFILAPDVPGMAIPVGYGINFFFTAGHYLADVWTGKLEAGQAASRVMKTGFDAFSPIGSGADSKSVAGTVAKTFAPSITVPLIEIAMNENRFGAPIFKGNNPNSDIKEADSYMNFRSANPLSTSLFRGLNDLTGGTRYKSGLIDVNPAKVDALINGYLPGVISEVYKGAGLTVRKVRGEETKDMPIPLVDRLTAKVPEQWDAGALRRAKEAVDTAFKEFNAPDTPRERRRELAEKYPGLGAAKAVLAGTDQQIKQINAQIEAFERDPRKDDDQKVTFRNKMEEKKKAIQNRAVRATLAAGFRNELVNEE